MVHSHHTSTKPGTTTGLEPSLTADSGLSLTGSEPMLGGMRRSGADLSQLVALLNASSVHDRRRIIAAMQQFGQANQYAAELAGMITPGTRHKVDNWRGTFTPTQRIRAIEALSEIGSYESITALLDTLADNTYRQVRDKAGEALAAICARFDPADPRTGRVFTLIAGMLRSLPLAGRKSAARILSDAPPDLVLGPLLQIGLHAPEWSARREAAWVLGKLGDKRATMRLIEMLEDESPAVRASTAWALGRLDAPVAVPALAGAAQDADEVVRAAAVEALGAQAGRMSVLDKQFKTALMELIDGLTDPDIAVRHAALEAIRSIDSPEARLALHDLINHPPVEK